MKINRLIYFTIGFVSVNLISVYRLSANCGSCGYNTYCRTSTCYPNNTSCCNTPCPSSNSCCSTNYNSCSSCYEPRGCPQPCCPQQPCRPEACCLEPCDCYAKQIAYHAGRIIGFYEAFLKYKCCNKFACTCWDSEKLRMNHDQGMSELEDILTHTNPCDHADIMLIEAKGVADAYRLYIHGSFDAVCQAYRDSLERLAYYKCINCPQPCAPCASEPCYTPCSTCGMPCPACPPRQSACSPAPCVTKPMGCSSCFLQSR